MPQRVGQYAHASKFRLRGNRYALPTPEERFWSKLRRPSLSAGEHSATSECWLWGLDPNRSGFGRIVIDGREVRVHRYAWELKNGPIPSGAHVLRRCGNARCVRPEHLFLGRASVGHAIGEAAHNAKLTEAEVKKIRLAAGEGVSMSALAAQFGVSKSNISRIVKRKTWRCV